MSQSTTPRIVPLRRPGQTSAQPGTTAKSSGKPLLIGVVILVLGVAGLLLTQPELLKLIPALKIVWRSSMLVAVLFLFILFNRVV